jgi:hypothetical protein
MGHKFEHIFPEDPMDLGAIFEILANFGEHDRLQSAFPKLCEMMSVAAAAAAALPLVMHFNLAAHKSLSKSRPPFVLLLCQHCQHCKIRDGFRQKKLIDKVNTR